MGAGTESGARSGANSRGSGDAAVGVTIVSASILAINGPSVKPVVAMHVKYPGTRWDSPTSGDRSSVNAIAPDHVRRSRTSASAGTTRTATAKFPAVLSQTVW